MSIYAPIHQKNVNRSGPSTVILGANFAGLKAALSLPEKFPVTVIDPWPWFEFSPNIHELISGFKTPEMLRFPKENIVKHSGHTFIPESVTTILPEKNTVVTSSGKHLFYDYCILAIGGQTNMFGVKGADTHTMPFKSVTHCHAIGVRLKQLVEKKRSFSIIIAGGGFEGVEALGEILRRYRGSKFIQVHMIEKHERMMNDAPGNIDGALRRLCAPYPVEFHNNTCITRTWKHSVDLSNNSKIPSQMTIWTGGNMPPMLLYDSGLSDAKDQWAPVNAFLQHVKYPNIFVAGDAAGTPFPLSKQAYHALDMGKTVAENIIRHHLGKSLKAFKPSSKPMLVSFGDLDAFFIYRKRVLAGAVLNILKEAVFQLIMNELDPSGFLLKAFHTSGRISTSTLKIASLMSFSPKSLAKLGNIRIII
jgi:NADH dehydrogenase FAD-containing subunit